MLVQVRFECKSFVTSGTDKWFGVRVGLNVSSKVGLVGKRLFANIACERFFPCKKITNNISFHAMINSFWGNVYCRFLGQKDTF